MTIVINQKGLLKLTAIFLLMVGIAMLLNACAANLPSEIKAVDPREFQAENPNCVLLNRGGSLCEVRTMSGMPCAIFTRWASVYNGGAAQGGLSCDWDWKSR